MVCWDLYVTMEKRWGEDILRFWSYKKIRRCQPLSMQQCSNSLRFEFNERNKKLFLENWQKFSERKNLVLLETCLEIILKPSQRNNTGIFQQINNEDNSKMQNRNLTGTMLPLYLELRSLSSQLQPIQFTSIRNWVQLICVISRIDIT